MHLQPSIFAGALLVGGRAGLGFESWQLQSKLLCAFVWSKEEIPQTGIHPL